MDIISLVLVGIASFILLVVVLFITSLCWFWDEASKEIDRYS